MNIAMMTNNYKPFIGGVPISVERLAEGLRRQGHQVTIFAPDFEGAKDEENVVRYRTFYRKPEKGIMVGTCLDPKIRRAFKEKRFDVIHVHHPIPAGEAALRLGEKYSIPVVYTYHTRYEEYLHHLLPLRGRVLSRCMKEILVPEYLTAFMNRCDLVISPTAKMKEYLEEQNVKTNIAVLPTGLDQGSFVWDSRRTQEIRSEHGKGRPWLFATTARLEKEKNLSFLLRGVAELKRRIGPCFRVMVIGNGSEAETLRRQAVELGIEEDVVFTGAVPNTEVRHYLHAADAFLFASKSETQGIVLLEAMAAGCPVVAVKASGVVDVVRSGENGFMTGESEADWAEAAARLTREPQLIRRLSGGAKDTASLYRAEEIAARAAYQYQRLIEKREEAFVYGETGRTLSVQSLLRLFETA